MVLCKGRVYSSRKAKVDANAVPYVVLQISRHAQLTVKVES